MDKKNKPTALIAVLFLIVNFGCQSFKRHDSSSKKHVPQVVATATEVKVSNTKTDNAKSDNAKAEAESVKLEPEKSTSVLQNTTEDLVMPESSLVKKSNNKFGIILSAGGAKAWGHIAVLKEMQKYKFPILSVAGVEWAAPVAAAFAQNTSSNEVEWEMGKFKDIDDWQDFIKSAFAKKTTQDFKIPFVCPSLNVKTKTSYMLNRGLVDQFIGYCIPSAGLLEPYGNSVANLIDLNLIIQHLKATGVNKIILVNVLPARGDKPLVKSQSSAENQIWAQYVASLAKKNSLIDEVIDIDLSEFSIEDFDQRRDIMVKAADLSYNQIKHIANKYKL